ncbi:MAG: hemerythrin domain-containing protein [Acetobacteraceae bacterium]|nr:hemerythrin domain-containing protein [Acetobacteraceae bacterium]
MQTHIARTLHDDHEAALALIARLEALLGRHGADYPPVAATPAVAALLRDCDRAIVLEIGPHFDFEETALFPRLEAAGAAAMVAVLTEEHAQIRPLAQTLRNLAREGQSGGFTAALWQTFRAAGAEFSSLMTAHITKEEIGLLPAVDEILDPETDAMLAETFASAR